MAEYIEREAVIRHLNDIRYTVAPQVWIDPTEWPLRRAEYSGLSTAIEVVAEAPAADVVERKKGEWIGFPESFKFEHIYDRDAIVCPFCEESWNIVDNDTERFNFCPNCGADMREALK